MTDNDAQEYVRLARAAEAERESRIRADERRRVLAECAGEAFWSACVEIALRVAVQRGQQYLLEAGRRTLPQRIAS